MKKTSWTPRHCGWLCLVAMAILAGCTASRQSTTSTNAEELLQKVQVQRIDLDLPDNMDKTNRLLWDRFVNQPYEGQFSGLKAMDWQANWPKFRKRLVALARAGGHDAAALGQIIDDRYPKLTANDAALPVGAFAARQGEDEVWILVIKRESISASLGPPEVRARLTLCHIGVTAYRIRDFRIVGGVSCD
ncbi:MAG TPA: hypothetical protein PK280_00245 [Planctomycetota bacterium]|nr:hypothetical protein [Planctomycetota bacterium]